MKCLSWSPALDRAMQQLILDLELGTETLCKLTDVSLKSHLSQTGFPGSAFVCNTLYLHY